jgi:pimeloyl-ACP methyl ester carboxylesterase
MGPETTTERGPASRVSRLAGPALAPLLALAVGCAGLRPTPTPMPVLRLAAGTEGTRCAVVLLPGRYNRPQAFADQGFARELAARGIDAEVVAPDAHFGYYTRRTVLPRLHEDVLAPLRERGRDRIWLVGISMGGTGALLYEPRYRGDVAGMLVLAPYLGEPEVVGEITAAGGLAAWRAPAEIAEGDFQRDLWRGLQAATRPGAGGPPLWLGYGTEDDLAPGHRLLAAALPPGRVTALPGGHDWKTWRRLWTAFLDSGELELACR